MTSKNYFTFILIGSILIISYASCGNAGEKLDTASLASADSLKKATADSIEMFHKLNVPAHPVYNDVALFIAGMPVAGSKAIDSSFINSKNWKEYSNDFDKSWQSLDTLKIEKMRIWRDAELRDATPKTVFYPFSGADFFNAFTFFPKAETIVMVGLEPVGTLPEFKKGMSKDAVAVYFRRVHQSLHSILNFSFFRTHSMSVDFNEKDLNGTIHLIVLFIERTGNTIADIKPAGIDTAGNIFNYKSFKEERNAASMNKGIEVDFFNSDKIVRKAYYFSVNLDNEHLNKNNNFSRMIHQNTEAITYIKSASYLMHKDYFSVVRDLILNNSKFILQDDSGIPYKYFRPETWTPALFGTYTGSIPLFNNVFQNDLNSAYKNTAITKPLNFGIGYKYKVGESNLMYFKKK